MHQLTVTGHQRDGTGHLSCVDISLHKFIDFLKPLGGEPSLLNALDWNFCVGLGAQ